MKESKTYYLISFFALFIVQFFTKHFELVLFSGFILGAFLNLESPFKTIAISQIVVLLVLISVQGIHWVAVTKFASVLVLPTWGLVLLVAFVSVVSVSLPALSGRLLKQHFSKV